MNENETRPDLMKIRILVLDRGFVLVGRCEEPTDFGFWLTVRDARIVRRWGTSNGLGELVNGPKPQTVLDAIVAKETIPTRAIIRVIEVEQEKWTPSLANLSGRTRQRAR